MTFADYLINCTDKENLVKVLHGLLDNAKGKNVAIVIMALERKKLLHISDTRTVFYEAMRILFGYIGTNQSINKFYSTGTTLDVEIEAKIQKVMDILP